MWQLEMHTWGTRERRAGQRHLCLEGRRQQLDSIAGKWIADANTGENRSRVRSHRSPDRIYALIETGDGVPFHGQPTDNGELWRSDDGGATWKVVSYDRNLACRQPYYTRMAVSTDNPDEAYFLVRDVQPHH
jgi:hypothetical protein